MRREGSSGYDPWDFIDVLLDATARCFRIGLRLPILHFCVALVSDLIYALDGNRRDFVIGT